MAAEDYDGELDIEKLLQKDAEALTDDDLKIVFEHYRQLRDKFAALDAKGKARDMKKKPKKEETADELLDVKVLG